MVVSRRCLRFENFRHMTWLSMPAMRFAPLAGRCRNGTTLAAAMRVFALERAQPQGMPLAVNQN
eukprot:318527-Amphidinium_carterae.1